ncbi:MAG TPA: type II secretion system protein [Burkholderiaceae bacterium]
MRTGRQRGFTYLFVLFFVALTAAGLAGLGRSWQNATERERERELEFRGGQIARAIHAYRKASPGIEQSPQSLAELIADRRAPVSRQHLRQLYVDPFTGQADWQLLPDPSDPRRFVGVRSRSSQELLRQRIGFCTEVRRASDCAFRAHDYAGGSLPAQAPTGAASAPV